MKTQKQLHKTQESSILHMGSRYHQEKKIFFEQNNNNTCLKMILFQNMLF